MERETDSCYSKERLYLVILELSDSILNEAIMLLKPNTILDDNLGSNPNRAKEKTSYT